MRIAVLQGDQTGQELLDEALRVLRADVIGVPLEFEVLDLSLENRRATRNAVVSQAAEALRRLRFGLKAATITPEGKDDVGSPNAILREEMGAAVIMRTGRRIPGVRPLSGSSGPIVVVRMAVGDAYRAKEWREGSGSDERAYRTTMISRALCRAVAEFSFLHAARIGGKVFGGPKYTVSPIYEGLLKEEMDAAAARHPEVPYEPQLIDAVYALLLQASGDALVIPALNRDGDVLSDMIMQMFGTVASGESLVMALTEHYTPHRVLAEAPHGTAPRLFRRNLANPLAMILAAAALLSYLPDPRAQAASTAIHDAAFAAIAAGIRTPDLDGDATTTEFTDEVIRRTRERLREGATQAASG